jgi:sulfur-carrier protein
VAVTIKVPTIFRPQVEGRPLLEVDEVDGDDRRTIRDVLDEVDRRYPGFKGRIVADDGSLRRFVNLYVNGEDVRYLGVLETEVADGDQVAILPAVAGGQRRTMSCF